MIRFLNRLSTRMPESWPGRVMWFAIAVLAFWFAYRFGINYGQCRAGGSNKTGCVAYAALLTQAEVYLDAITVFVRVTSFILP